MAKDDLTTLKKEIATLKKRVSALEAGVPSEEVIAPEAKERPMRAHSTADSGKILGWIGGLVLALGVIFFIAYAFDQGWVSRSMQVVFGVLLGIILMIAGHVLNKKIALQGNLLTGVGVATAYFAIYAGYAVEAYRAATNLTIVAVVPLLLIVLIAAAVLSLKQKNTALLIEALILAYITTFLGAFTWLTVAYVLVAAIGYSVLVYTQKSSTAGWIGGGVSLFMVLVWLIQTPAAMLWTIIAGIFATFTLLSLMRKNELAGVLSLVGAYLPSVFLVLRESKDPSWITLTAVVLAAILYVLLHAQGVQATGYLLAAIGFFALWIPMQFTASTITIIWAALGAVIGAYAATTKKPALRVASVVLFALVLGKLLFMDSWHLETLERVWAFLFSAVALLVLSYVQALHDDDLSHFSYIAGVAALVLIVPIELSKLWVTLLWGALGIGSYVLGMATSRAVPKNIGLAVIALAIIKLFVVDTLTFSAGLRIIAYLVLGALLLGGSILYAKKK